MKQKRALSSRGGPRSSRGDAALAAVLERAFARSAGRDPDLLTHGFHAWPARMHPLLARSLLDELKAPLVLDPFSGSGTTLVEARRLGVRATGVDLNPLARLVAEVKCRVTTEAERAAFLAGLEKVALASHARVKAKAPARAPLPQGEVRRYQGHVLRELAGLRAEIDALDAGDDKRALLALFSAIVVKFSRQRSDTTGELVDKRIGRHVPTSFFERRGRELVERWAAYAREVPRGAPPPRVLEGDARALSRVVGDERFPLVVSSPPYGGTYDYAEHHARRFPWLGLDARALLAKEIGARRTLSEGDEGASERWDREVRAFLSSIAAVVAPGALVVLLLGDAEVGGRRVPADQQLERLAPGAGLAFAASASEERADWRGGKKRREHLVALAASSPSPSRSSGGMKGKPRAR